MVSITCPVCGENLSKRPADGICPSCGIPLDSTVTATAPSATAAPTMAAAPGAPCPVCGAAVKPGATVCDECGVNLNEARAQMAGVGNDSTAGAATTCPVCDARIKPGATVCDECGVNLAQAQATMAQVASPDSASSSSSGPTCPSCGAPRRAGASFCRECGESFPPETQKTEGLLATGDILGGRYRVERKLGGGGMGAVYLSEDMRLRGKPVAIKAVLNSDDPDLLRAARQEVENLLGIDHPNIVRLRDIVEKGTIPFIVMDYLEGPDWNDLYEERVAKRNEAFTAEEAVRMILSILPAFEYLHGRRPPIVYRDFKPGQVKRVTDSATGVERDVLLDLGVAYAFEGIPVEAWGTPGYAPPEVGGVCLQPPAMDVACLCRTLEGLLGIDLASFPYGQMPPPESVPWITEELYHFIERGTALDPRRRFQTLGELRTQLEGVLRLIQGRAGTIPRPAGAFHAPVVSRLFTGNLQRTTGQLISLPVPPPDDPAGPLLDQANEMLLQGKVEDALQQAEAALQQNRKSTSALLLKTVALAQLGRKDEARSHLQQVSKLTDVTSDWSYAIVAAQLAEDSDDVATAEQLYRDLLRLVPGEIPPRQKLANLLLRQKRFNEAATLYEQIVGADPANAEAILNWADSLAALGQAEQSIDVLRRVGENAVRFVDAQMRMIDLLVQRAHHDPTALSAAAAAIESLQGRTQTPRYYRLVGDWWFEAYQLAQRSQVGAIQDWPQLDAPKDIHEIAAKTRDAYHHYLRVTPDRADADEIIGRIHFGIRQMM